MSHSMESTSTRGFLNMFLTPENVDLKIIFDNIRNYIICGGILAIGRALEEGRLGSTITFANKENVLPIFVLWLYALVFFNILQTVAIFERLFATFAHSVNESTRLKPRVIRIAGYALIGVGLCVMFFLALSLIMVTLLIFLGTSGRSSGL